MRGTGGGGGHCWKMGEKFANNKHKIMLFDFFCLSLSDAALLAHAVIIILPRRREEGIELKGFVDEI